MSGTARNHANPPAMLRASGRQRRLEILAAALRIMARDGLRAVSHRSVAAEAAVPLAATTYYFRDLEDLITEAFLHWSLSQQALVEAFHGATTTLLREARRTRADGVDGPGDEEAADGRRADLPDELIDRLADAAAVYVIDQVQLHRGDRVLEYAFLHEALRMPRLRAVVSAHQSDQLDFLERFHAELGSSQPAIDAQVSHGLVLGLEKVALLMDDGGAHIAAVRAVLASHLRRSLRGARPAE